MKKPNLNALSIKESINITEFKKNLRSVQHKIQERPIMVTNNHASDIVMLSADRYNELLAYAKKQAESGKKG